MHSSSLALIVYHISVSWLRDASHWSWCYFTVSDPSGKAGLQSIIKGLKLLEWAFIVVVCAKVTLTVCSLHPRWQAMTRKGSDASSQSHSAVSFSSMCFVIAVPSKDLVTIWAGTRLHSLNRWNWKDGPCPKCRTWTCGLNIYLKIQFNNVNDSDLNTSLIWNVICLWFLN